MSMDWLAGDCRRVLSRISASALHVTLKGALRRGLLCAVIYTMAAAMAVSPDAAFAAGKVVTLSKDESQPLMVPKGKSATVRLEISFSDIVVGDTEIATVAPLTDRSLYVIGKAVGATSVAVFDTEKNLIGSLEVEVSSDTTRLKRQLQKSIPGAAIRV